MCEGDARGVRSFRSVCRRKIDDDRVSNQFLQRNLVQPFSVLYHVPGRIDVGCRMKAELGVRMTTAVTDEALYVAEGGEAERMETVLIESIA